MRTRWGWRGEGRKEGGKEGGREGGMRTSRFQIDGVGRAGV